MSDPEDTEKSPENEQSSSEGDGLESLSKFDFDGEDGGQDRNDDSSSGVSSAPHEGGDDYPSHPDGYDEDVMESFSVYGEEDNEGSQADAGFSAFDDPDSKQEGEDGYNETEIPDEHEPRAGAWYTDTKNLVMAGAAAVIFGVVVLPNLLGGGENKQPQAQKQVTIQQTPKLTQSQNVSVQKNARADVISPPLSSARGSKQAKALGGEPKPTLAEKGKTAGDGLPSDRSSVAPADAMRLSSGNRVGGILDDVSEANKKQAIESAEEAVANAKKEKRSEASRAMAGFGQNFYEDVGDRPYITYRRSRVEQDSIPQDVISPDSMSKNVSTNSVVTTEFRDTILRRRFKSGMGSISKKLDLLASAVGQQTDKINELSLENKALKDRLKQPRSSATAPNDKNEGSFFVTKDGDIKQRITKTQESKVVHAGVMLASNGAMVVAPKIIRQSITDSEKPSVKFEVVGAIEGKAWMRSLNGGKIISVAVGDRLADYGSVTKVLPDGTVVTSSGERFYLTQSEG